MESCDVNNSLISDIVFCVLLPDCSTIKLLTHKYTAITVNIFTPTQLIHTPYLFLIADPSAFIPQAKWKTPPQTVLPALKVLGTTVNATNSTESEGKTVAKVIKYTVPPTDSHSLSARDLVPLTNTENTAANEGAAQEDTSQGETTKPTEPHTPSVIDDVMDKE